MIGYKDYLIAPIQTSPGRWRAEISRADGRIIKVLVTGSERHSLITDGMEAFSARGAIERAKEAIDRGGMNQVRGAGLITPLRLCGRCGAPGIRSRERLV